MRSRPLNFFDTRSEHPRPPRIIEPLQHVFDPIIGSAARAGPSSQWGTSPVSISRFSSFPQIVFDRLPVLRADRWADMLYDLRCRLMEPTLHAHRALPGVTFCPHAPCAAIDATVTILPA